MAKDFSEGLGLVRAGGQWLFLDKNGNVKIKCSKTYTEVYPFHSGRARVSLNRYFYGYIDQAGTEVIPCELYGADDFDRGFAIVDMRDIPPVRNRYMGVISSHTWLIDVDGNRHFPDEAKRIQKMSPIIKPPSDEQERLKLQKNCVDYCSKITLLGRTFRLTSTTKLGLIERKKELLENIKTVIYWLEKDVAESEKTVGYQKNYNSSHKAKKNQ